METNEKKYYKDEKLDQLAQLAGKIIIKFVTDKFQGKISPDYIKSVIENTNFYFKADMNMDTRWWLSEFKKTEI